MLDDIGGEPGSDGKGKIDEKDGSLTKVLVSVIIIEFWYHVLKGVERGEHQQEADAEIGDPEILLVFSVTILLNLGHLLG